MKAIMGTKRSQEKTEKIQAEYKIEASYTDIDECLKSDAFDTVYVAVPNHLHYSFAKGIGSWQARDLREAIYVEGS